MSAFGGKADLVSLDVPNDSRCVEHGAIDANAFHCLPVGRVHKNRASGTAANGAGHEFFELDLARQVVTRRKFGNSS